MEPLKVGDLCEVIYDGLAFVRPSLKGQQVEVIGVFVGRYCCSKRCGLVEYDIRLQDGDAIRADRRCLRKINPPPKREDLQVVNWRDVFVWRPDQVHA